jgi:hypothetical protein
MYLRAALRLSIVSVHETHRLRIGELMALSDLGGTARPTMVIQ